MTFRWPKWRTVKIHGLQLVLLAVILAAWQWLPEIPTLRNASPVFNSFFVSSPSKVASALWHDFVGGGATPTLWAPLLATLKAAGIGIAAGAFLGGLGGLVISNSDGLYRVVTPFLTAFNAMPRIALIPIYIIIFGPTETAASVTAAVLVLFVVLFNAVEGGRSIPRETLQNARILGTGNMGIIVRIRLPFVLAWIFAAVPTAVGFGLGGAITAEVLTGYHGLGGVLSNSMLQVNATNVFAIVVVAGLIGVLAVLTLERLRRRILHWWDSNKVAIE